MRVIKLLALVLNKSKSELGSIKITEGKINFVLNTNEELQLFTRFYTAKSL